MKKKNGRPNLKVLDSKITAKAPVTPNVAKPGQSSKVESTSTGRPNLTVLNSKMTAKAPVIPNVAKPGQSSKVESTSIDMKGKVESKPNPQPKENASKSTTEAANTANNSTTAKFPPKNEANKPVKADFKGRMTAASFMTKVPAYFQNYPKGIPKSFLNQPQYQYTETVPGPSTTTAGWVPVGNNQSAQNADVSNSQKSMQGQNTAQTPVPNMQMLDHNQKESPQKELSIKTEEGLAGPPQQYSPSEVYGDGGEGNEDTSDLSPESGSKRLSAFQRLGPLSQPKKPKLTINLLCNKNESVREVLEAVVEDDSKYTPGHLRADIQTSTDDVVMKHALHWPWNKTLPPPRKTVTHRHSKTVMQLELEHMEESYERESAFFQITVKGYPASWSKEDVLDTILESIKRKSFIPCFIEFLKHECKFLVIRCKAALSEIHRLGFIVQKDDVELVLSISQFSMSALQLEFIPRIVLRKRLQMAMENETELNLSEFTTKSDISHFIYFPLRRVANQSELVHIQSSVPWHCLTKLDLSRNRLTSFSGFNFHHTMPKLRHLDLSHNHLESLSPLVQCRSLPLNAIALEGNPLCTDFIEQEIYIKALRMIFPALREIDGIKLCLRGEFPKFVRNYSPPEAHHVVGRLLEVMFPLLDAPPQDRASVEDLYDVNATMTITYYYKLRYTQIYKEYRNLFNRARWIEEEDMDCVRGAGAIANLVYKWPILCHDPSTFTVDVIYHTNTTTIVRVSGIMKVTTESLAVDEHVLSFTRTMVLNSIDGFEYKIVNEMVHWELPEPEVAGKAFRLNKVRSKNISLKFETPPDEELKEQLVEIFMKLTEMDRKPSKTCLESKDWHLRDALEYFSKLLKFDNLEPLVEKECVA